MAPKKTVEPEKKIPVEGEGSFYYANGATYSGGWKLVDEGTVLADGSAAKAGRLRHGKGVYRDGDYSFEGDFVDDAMQGQGTFRFASGASYIGGWMRNRYHGQGTFVWPNGSMYEGDFEQNVMHGSGCYKDTEGRVWSGKFFQGSGPGLTYDLP